MNMNDQQSRIYLLIMSIWKEIFVIFFVFTLSSLYHLYVYELYVNERMSCVFVCIVVFSEFIYKCGIRYDKVYKFHSLIHTFINSLTHIYRLLIHILMHSELQINVQRETNVMFIRIWLEFLIYPYLHMKKYFQEILDHLR